MNAILCVTDFSPASKQVIETAANMAADKIAKLIIVFPFRLVTKDKGTDVMNLKTSLSSDAEKKFSAVETSLKEKAIKYEFCMEIGFISDRIKSHLKCDPIGLVVIGNRQMNLIPNEKGVALESFINELRVPVVVVPEDGLQVAA